MRIIYHPERARYEIERPGPSVKQYARSLGIKPRKDRSIWLPALQIVSTRLEEFALRAGLSGFELPLPRDSVDDIIDGTEAAVPHEPLRESQVRHCSLHGRRAEFDSRNPGCIRALLASDTGCGKTAEALRLWTIATKASDLSLRPEHTVVVCPKMARSVWTQEFARWLGGQPDDIQLMHYEQVQRAESLPPCDMLIVDEADRLANRQQRTAQGRRTQARGMLALAQTARHVVLITATPARNKAHDIWGLLHALDPVLYSSFWVFVRAHFDVAQQDWGWEVGDEALHPEDLAAEAAQWTTRTRRHEVFPGMSYTLQRVPALLGNQDRQLYDAAEENALPDPFRNALEQYTWLRQFTIAPELLGGTDGSGSGKVWLAQELCQLSSESVVVMSDFTRPLLMLAHAFPDEGALLVGSNHLSEDQQQQNLAAFQAGDIQFLFASLRLAGKSIDLSRASRLIMLDPTLSPTAWEQAIGRFLRPGQKCLNVLAQLLYVPDTLDEYIIEMVHEKQRALSVFDDASAERTLKEARDVREDARQQ